MNARPKEKILPAAMIHRSGLDSQSFIMAGHFIIRRYTALVRLAIDSASAVRS